MARFLEHYANRLLSPYIEKCDDGSGVQFKGGSIHGKQVHLKCDALERALQGNADQPPLKLSLAHIDSLQIDVPWTLSGDIEIVIDQLSVLVVQRDMRGGDASEPRPRYTVAVSPRVSSPRDGREPARAHREPCA